MKNKLTQIDVDFIGGKEPHLAQGCPKIGNWRSVS